MKLLFAAATSDPIVRIIDKLTGLLVGWLTALGILALVYAGIRYVLAGGDPAGIERAKGAIKGAVVGFALVLGAPMIVSLLRRVVG